MHHPVIATAHAKVLYDSLLQDAESHRRLKRLEAGKPNLLKRIMAPLGSMFAQSKPHTCQDASAVCQPQPILDVRKHQNA